MRVPEAGRREARKGSHLPRRVGGRYRPIRVIGRGGASVVYEAEHLITRNRVALKLLRTSVHELEPAAVRRFRHEARISSLIKSEHVVRVYDADIDTALGGLPFLVMEFLDGRDLGAVTGQTPQPAARVCGWLCQVASALDEVHRMGIVHRDLKVENLLLTCTGGKETIKVLDFGIAKVLSTESVGRTTVGAVVGTPLYMAPEQVAGAEVRPAADIWALGLCAYRLLSGRDYWARSTVQSLLAEIIQSEMCRPSSMGLDLGEEFDSWFLKSCARDPSARWSSVYEQIEELARALGQPAPLGRTLVPGDVAGSLAEAPGPDTFGESHESVNPSIGSSTELTSTRSSRTAVLVGLATLVAAFAASASLFRHPSVPVGAGVSRSNVPTKLVEPTRSTAATPSFTPIPSMRPEAPAASTSSGPRDSRWRKAPRSIAPRALVSARPSMPAPAGAIEAVPSMSDSLDIPIRAKPARTTLPLPTSRSTRDPLADPH